MLTRVLVKYFGSPVRNRFSASMGSNKDVLDAMNAPCVSEGTGELNRRSGTSGIQADGSNFYYEPKKPGWYKKKASMITKAQKKSITSMRDNYFLNIQGYQSKFDLQKEFAYYMKKRTELGLGLEYTVPQTKPLVVMELGFGYGENILDLAKKHCDAYFVGVETHGASIGMTCQKVADARINNVLFHQGDGIRLLNDNIPDASVDEIIILFPDPWVKTGFSMDSKARASLERLTLDKCRGWTSKMNPSDLKDEAVDYHVELHMRGKTLSISIAELNANVGRARKNSSSAATGAASKGMHEITSTYSGNSVINQTGSKKNRGQPDLRIINLQTIPVLYHKLKQGGVLHIATDVDVYAEHVDGVFSEFVENGYFRGGCLTHRPEWRALTRYEKRAIDELKHNIYDFSFIKL